MICFLTKNPKFLVFSKYRIAELKTIERTLPLYFGRLKSAITTRIVLQCPNSLDGIEGFCFLGLRWAYKNSPFFSGDKIGIQRTSETGF